jgi:hypothetical protein
MTSRKGKLRNVPVLWNPQRLGEGRLENFRDCLVSKKPILSIAELVAEGQSLQAGVLEGVENAPEGIANLGTKLKHWCPEERSVWLLRLSFSARDHQLCGLGLPSLLPELSRCRGSSRGAGNHRVL